jgi:ubiquinone/menaquinone biosynthesis C-methylase UbiE
MQRARYVPALRFTWLTRAYDPIVRLTTRERRFKRMLVEQVQLRPGMHVLDVGCGTGTLAMELKRTCPEAVVSGIDGDPDVLALARAKIERAGLAIDVRHALATELPFSAATFDRVVSSLVFHHLDRETKRAALREIARVLVPGGELHIADWGRPHGPFTRAAFLGVQLLDGFETTRDSVEGVLPALIAEVGYRDVVETRRLRTPLGTIALYQARDITVSAPLGSRPSRPL